MKRKSHSNKPKKQWFTVSYHDENGVEANFSYLFNPHHHWGHLNNVLRETITVMNPISPPSDYEIPFMAVIWPGHLNSNGVYTASRGLCKISPLKKVFADGRIEHVDNESRP
jgi:hypothetical protein